MFDWIEQFARANPLLASVCGMGIVCIIVSIFGWLMELDDELRAARQYKSLTDAGLLGKIYIGGSPKKRGEQQSLH